MCQISLCRVVCMCLGEVVTYADTPVRTGSDEMHVVELQCGDGAGVAHQAAVDLSASQIPQPHHAVCGTACQCGIEDLDGADKVCRGVHGPPRGAPPLSVVGGLGRGCLGSSPENIESLHAAALDKVPLSQGLVCRARDKSITAEVQSRDFVDVRFEREHEQKRETL